MIYIIAFVSFLVGSAFAYWLVEKRLKQQKQDQIEQTRRFSEEIERSHQSRIKETVQSLQAEQENRLRQATEELEQVHNSRLEESVKSLQEQHEAQLIQVSDELQKTYEVKMQENEQYLQEQHETKLSQVTEELQQTTEELARNYEAQKQSAINQLQAEYEANLKLAAEQFENQEAQMQNQIKLLQEHYESQLKKANEELQNNEAYTQQTVRILQTHYESQLGKPDAIELPQVESPQPELPQIETPIVSDSAPIEVEELVTKIPTVNLPTNSRFQELENQIVAWGNAHQFSFVNQLISYSNHQNTQIRKLVAAALGKIAAVNGLRIELQCAIPILGKLSKDFDAQVRLSAVEALGAIKSDKVIPFLESSLRDTDGLVVKAANLAIGKFRYYPAKSAAKPKDIKLNKPQR